MHQKMMIDRKLDDLTNFGDNIARTCKNSASNFLLKKQHLIGENHNGNFIKILPKFIIFNYFALVDKRSVEKRCEHSSNFIESGGKFTIAYHLVC